MVLVMMVVVARRGFLATDDGVGGGACLGAWFLDLGYDFDHGPRLLEQLGRNLLPEAVVIFVLVVVCAEAGSVVVVGGGGGLLLLGLLLLLLLGGGSGGLLLLLLLFLSFELREHLERIRLIVESLQLRWRVDCHANIKRRCGFLLCCCCRRRAWCRLWLGLLGSRGGGGVVLGASIGRDEWRRCCCRCMLDRWGTRRLLRRCG